MRLTPSFLSVFAALAVAVTGCSGSGTNAPGIPATTNGPQIQTANAPASMGIDGSRACRYRHSCPAKLIVPLTFDGRGFVVGKYASCRSVSLSDAQRYTTRRTRRLFLRKSVSLAAQCVPTSKSARLFIAVAEVGRSAHRPAGSIEVDSTGTRSFFIPIGNLVNTGKKWTFHAAGLGTKLNANAKYVFYVVSAPLDAISTGNFVFLQPLSFNGSAFSVVPNSCYEDDQGDAPVYTAPSSGPLTLSGTVTMTPACVPSSLPPNPPPLYIVAVNVGAGGSSDAMRPMDDNLGVNAVPVAGPVNVEDNPWNFAPDSPGLTMTAGDGYAFFIAAALPPPPPPTQSFGEVIPLSFDGSSFTVPSISSCTALPTAAPFTAPTSGPLTLAGSVSIAPTCVPSSSSSSSSSSGSGQLYIVAAVTCFAGNQSSSGSDSSNSGNCCNSSSSNSSSSGCGSNSQNAMRRPHDGGGCSTGLQGGGEDVVRMQPRDQGNACTVFGYAIAGPVNPGDNPWMFAPLAPPLNLTAGSQYTFYVGVANQDDNSQ